MYKGNNGITFRLLVNVLYYRLFLYSYIHIFSQALDVPLSEQLSYYLLG